MRLTGFLRENMNIVCVDDIHISETPNDVQLLARIQAYLLQGKTIISFMHICVDEQENLIGPSQIYTDGNWVWPNYLIYFLNKYQNLKIDADFIAHMVKNDFTIDEFDMTNIQKEYVKLGRIY
ncbi:hypothetical protein WSM22_31430 [Cytophagales bacterium WSM2-2]|nr:hypothetical protein WSM22_31430 [Cytophagales bacterium WSM2-2]